ncbi:MAG: glycosyltransferase family 2 protein [Anaerolineae bacterium]|nr:glycosyltransferase family 2 protein [Anaerolineae bacterium]
MSEQKPRVSIGLPVYNGETLVREALDSILAQTYTDFELIICDNASTDSTPEICKAYAEKDSRVRYYRNAKNLGVSRNLNLCFELSCGEYFMWRAHDDLMAPDYVEKCVAFLDAHPDYVQCYGRSKGVDLDRNEVFVYTYNLRTESDQPAVRMYDLVMYEHPVFQTFGVTRASAMRQTPLFEHYATSDRIFIAHLGLMGKIHRLDEFMHFDRWYPGTSVRKYRSIHRLTIAYYNPHWSEDKIFFPAWMQLFGLLRAVMAHPMSLSERLHCFGVIYQWMKRYRKKLWRDIRYALKKPLGPLYYRLRPDMKPKST